MPAEFSSDSSSRIILASASPRRRELLAQVGIAFSVVASRVEEEVLPGESPAMHALRLSREKAREVASRPEVEGRWFIGSDTIVVRDESILNKPADAEDARRMLLSLSGRTHQVLSGYAVYDRITGREISDVVATTVWFKKLTAAEIAGYIASREPLDKAGAYAIQGLGAFMIPRIDGSYTNVVGLPLCEVIAALEKLEAIELFRSAP